MKIISAEWNAWKFHMKGNRGKTEGKLSNVIALLLTVTANLGIVITYSRMQVCGCITLMGNNEVLVKSKDGEMKIEEELQRELLDDQWEEADKHVDEG